MDQLPLVLQYHISSFLKISSVHLLERCSRYWRDTPLRPDINYATSTDLHRIMKYKPHTLFIPGEINIKMFDKTEHLKSIKHISIEYMPDLTRLVGLENLTLSHRPLLYDLSELKLTTVDCQRMLGPDIIKQIPFLPTTVTNFVACIEVNIRDLWNAFEKRGINIKRFEIGMLSDISFTNIESVKCWDCDDLRLPPSLREIDFRTEGCEWIDKLPPKLNSLTVDLFLDSIQEVDEFTLQASKLCHIEHIDMSINALHGCELPEFLLPKISSFYANAKDIINATKMPNLTNLKIDIHDTHEIEIHCAKSSFPFWPKLLTITFSLDNLDPLFEIMDMLHKSKKSENHHPCNHDRSRDYIIDYDCDVNGDIDPDINTKISQHINENGMKATFGINI